MAMQYKRPLEIIEKTGLIANKTFRIDRISQMKIIPDQYRVFILSFKGLIIR
jgi:hypothetical protein